MKYISLFSGIEAATVAFEPLGWSAVCFSEIEPFPSAVLHHHYPGIPNVGDVLKHDWSQYKGQVDVMVGGPPCQAFSVAGLRESLQDDRGNLSLAWARAIDAVEPRYAITENVPGWLSTKDNAFGCFVGAIVGADAALVLARGQRWTDAGMVVGPKRAAAWRVLDAQHFGLAQRRRRVFVVCCPRNGANPAAVLFERESLSGHPAPRREAREVSTADAGSGVAVGGGEVAPTLSRRYSYDRGDGAEPLVTCYENHGNDSRITEAGDVRTHITARAGTGGGNLPLVLAHCQANAEVVRDGSPSLSCNHEAPIVAYGIDEECNGDGQGGTHQAVAFHVTQDPISGDVSPALSGGSKQGCGTVGVAQAFTQKQVGDVLTGDVAASMGTNQNASGRNTPKVMVDAEHQSLYNEGITSEEDADASAQESHAVTLLRVLREEVGEEAFTQWGLGILNSLQPPEVLRSALHGLGIRPATFTRCWLVYNALSREKGDPGWLLQSLRETECAGCPPSGWRPPEQFARELGTYLSELSLPGPQAQRFMRDLWQADEGVGLLRQALSAVQEVGRSSHSKGQPAHGMQVRRLVVQECEFLQGFPRNYTAIPWRGKPAPECPDGPRYKALGNSMAVPVMRWIGERIAMVEEVTG